MICLMYTRLSCSFFAVSDLCSNYMLSAALRSLRAEALGKEFETLYIATDVHRSEDAAAEWAAVAEQAEVAHMTVDELEALLMGV
jgi:hypothetical protein